MTPSFENGYQMLRKSPSRRRLLELSGIALVGGTAGCTGSDGLGEPSNAMTTDETETETEETTDAENDSSNEGGEDGDFEIEPAAGAFADVPIPDSPDEYRYATVGSGDAPVTATFYGGWKCGYTQEFVLGSFGELVEEFVASGDVDVEFRAVPYRGGESFHGDDEPRAARAGLTIWDVDPESYWSFFEHMFTNMRSRVGWATTEKLMTIAEASGVERRDEIRETIEIGAFEAEAEVQRTMERVHEIPISAIPRMVVNGTVTAPSVDPSVTKRQLRNAVDGARTER